MAVYTEVSDEELKAFIDRYDVGDLLSCKGIAEGVENSNFFIQTSQSPYILTLYEKRVNPDDLPFFLGLLEHLWDKGIRCSVPLRDKNGRALQTLAGRPAALFTFLDGMWPRKIAPFHCAELGKAMARMHLAGLDYELTRENDLSLSGWRPLFDSCADRADEVRPGLAGMLDRELTFLENHWPDDLPVGVCHADLFPDNVFFRDDTVSGIIDFYFACNDALVYDLAVCLNAWCFERDRSFNLTKAQLMLSNYRKERALSRQEIAALPILARGAAVRFLLTRLYDWLNHPEGAFVQPKDPLEYHAYLSFHQRVSSAADYGVE